MESLVRLRVIRCPRVKVFGDSRGERAARRERRLSQKHHWCALFVVLLAFLDERGEVSEVLGHEDTMFCDRDLKDLTPQVPACWGSGFQV